MKNVILVVLALMSLNVFAASANDENFDLLLSHDYMRAFYSPCDEKKLRREVEVAEMDFYFSQGFELTAKIRMPPRNLKGYVVPECMYLFVLKSKLRD